MQSLLPFFCCNCRQSTLTTTSDESLPDPSHSLLASLLACLLQIPSIPINQRLCYRPIQFNNSVIDLTLGNSLALHSSAETRLPRPPLLIRQRQLQSKMKHLFG